MNTIGVIGLGMVGGTVYKYYKNKKDFKVMGWSPSSQLDRFEDLVKADYIFICVPTPYDWKENTYKLNILEETLVKIPAGKKVIIKSTIPPKTTENLQKKYPDLNLFFNPEFLSEATAERDFSNPDRQLLGYTKESYKFAIEVLHLLPMSPFDVIITSTEAEIAKYVNNFHGALMVMFSNLVYDICEKTGSDYERVKKSAQASKWVGSPMGRMYWDVLHGGFRGYGGKCFPKDVNSLINWCKENGVNAEILEATKKANERILKSQKLDEAKAEKISSRQL